MGDEERSLKLAVRQWHLWQQAWPLLTTRVFLHQSCCFLHWQCSVHHEEERLLFIPHGGTGFSSTLPGTRVGFFNDMATHAEPCINADFDSSRLVGSSGLTVHSHMNRRDAYWRDAQQWGHGEEGGSLSAPSAECDPSKAEFLSYFAIYLFYFDPSTAFSDIPLFRSCYYSIFLFLNAQKRAFFGLFQMFLSAVVW